MAGRKKKAGDVLSARIIVLMTDAERVDVEKKAFGAGMSASAFSRKKITEAK